ncbi:chorion peroxidase-like [Biomphalaria glabrata]|uniref:Chorion peroxidase-like n=1 Tax=Biomphalaria glabrata TaxID=6526 RepID=A0A9W3AA25_BIOGL|nr:chorion peroxidase-like [Biomphalaria glabrata]
MVGLQLSLVICLYFIDTVQSTGPYCAAHPDLYYANVNGLIAGGYDNTVIGDQSLCSKDVSTLRYREVDGRCNHPKDYGSTVKPLKRYLKPHYQDDKGMNTPRIYSVVGKEYLPSPRLISLKLFPDVMKESDLSMFTMQFGQFVSHDIGVSPVPTGSNGTIKCCGVSAKQMSKECFPIPIPKEDSRFEYCMEFVRSEAAKDEYGNQMYPREQINALTSFIDGSNIYGSDIITTQRLRTENGKGILLSTTIVNGKERLPNDTSSKAACVRTTSPTSYCQLSGDKRVNQQPVLGTQHLTFHLYHNELARRIVEGIIVKKTGVKPTPEQVEKYIATAPDNVKEILFQEVKRINNAIFQRIAVCDYLPFVIGRSYMEMYKLTCTKRSRYNPYVDPRLANGFIAAAYRFGHTLIPNSYPIKGVPEFFKDEFFTPDSSIDSHEEIIEGMLTVSNEVRFDRHFAKAITEHLFENNQGAKNALDLASLNIQRGRDHGIPGHYFWRMRYNLSAMNDFDDYGEECGPVLKKLYKSVYDIDLYAGGICEPAVPGGAVGDTFANIIANQFADLKYGDRWFFTHRQKPQGFNDAQLEAILNVHANTLLCYSGKLPHIQRNTWLKVSDKNPIVPCSQFEHLDVDPFVEEILSEGYIQ